MRKPIIAANWKMHKTVSEAWSFVNQLKPLLDGVAGVEVVICPPFPLLPAVGQALAGTGWALGAQNLHWEKQGAFTGEVSGPMLADLGCKYVVIGHSERRQFFGETDHSVNLKVKAAFANQPLGDGKHDVAVNPVAGTVTVLGTSRQQELVQQYL
ncbi:MAG: triose-phosphate isomerase, partial [Actinobacteria bacterium]|nr:triose-phosphate isomerase [Actinomycetota bacterium]